MSEHDDDLVTLSRRSPGDATAQARMIVALIGVLLVASLGISMAPSPSVLLVASPAGSPVAPVLDGHGLAAATVGLVLAEAIVLYVGYGALTRVAGPVARELLGRTARE